MFLLPSNQPRIQEKITTNTVIVARAVVYLLFVFIHTFVNPVRLPWWLSGKESACSAGDLGSIPGLGISPGGGHGNPLQYSCLENSMDRGSWWTIVHRVTQSQTSMLPLMTVSPWFALICDHFFLFPSFLPPSLPSSIPPSFHSFLTGV